MTITAREKKKFQQIIFRWWKSHKRDLPWRQTLDPYHIAVSEIMLQQTQVSRVLPKYQVFLFRFPTVYDLARASKSDVLKLWQGLGYNRRALYIHAMAVAIVTHHNGVFPDNEQQLLTLPGLGKYTARALLVFAYKQDIAMVDTNIRQIITHFFFGNNTPPEKELYHVADQLVPIGRSWEWHQALMDYGAMEMLNFKLPMPNKKKIPFRESRRFFRGRIVDLIRERSRKENEIIAGFEEKYGKSVDFTKELVNGLASDGLLTRFPNGIISLPE